MDIVDKIIERMSASKEFSEVFTPEIIEELAELDEKKYESVKLQAEAHCIMNGIELRNIRNLDKLVMATRAIQEERSASRPLVPLGEWLVDVPHPNLFTPGGWTLLPEGVYRTDARDNPRFQVCTVPVYAGEKYIDPDRGKTSLVVFVKTDKWRKTVVPASMHGEKVASVLTDLGALVLCPKGFAEYWKSFLRTNWGFLPATKADYALYDEIVAFATDNLDKIAEKEIWGRIVRGKKSVYLALKPEIVRKFTRSAGVSADHLLEILKEKKLLLTDGGSRFKTVWFNGRARRMVAIVWPQDETTESSQKKTGVTLPEGAESTD